MRAESESIFTSLPIKAPLKNNLRCFVFLTPAVIKNATFSPKGKNRTHEPGVIQTAIYTNGREGLFWDKIGQNGAVPES